MKWLMDMDRSQGSGNIGLITRIGRAGLRFLRRENGISLLETITGMAILGMIGVGFMSALGSTFQATNINDEKVVAENLVRTQLEFLRSQPYCEPGSVPYTIPTDGACGTYAVPPTGVTPPTGYTMTVELNTYCCDASANPYPIAELQQITATVFRDGTFVSQTSDLKTNR